MANNQAFKIKNGLSAGRYLQNVGTETAGSVGYDLAGASYDSVNFSVSSQESNPLGLFFKPDGTTFYAVGSSSDTVYQYTLSTAWDISTASYASKSVSVSAANTSPCSLFFKPDGTKMYVAGFDGDADVNEYDLSTAWDVSTATYLQRVSVDTRNSQPTGLFFNTDGTKMFTCGQGTDVVSEFNLSAAWSVSTASYSQNFSFASQTIYPRGLLFKSDGTKMYITSYLGVVYQYNISTAFDVSTASYDSVSFDASTQETQPYDLVFKADGSKLYIVGTTGSNIHQYSTGYATQTLDLSTGNYFSHTLTEDIKIELSNPPASGKAYAAQIEVTGGAVGPAGLFSTTLYTGNGSTQTITNGIDLDGEGGLVWIKSRSSTREHSLYDTERGVEKLLKTNSTGAEQNTSGGLTAFNSDGFSLGTYADINGTAYGDFASWTFRKAPNFFDVVTYTGNGVAGRTVAHSLGSVPGSIIVKATNNARSWAVYHKDADSTAPEDYVLYLDVATNKQNDATLWNDTAPTSTDFTVGTSGDSNVSGREYVAYLFADDDTNRIKCGGYLGNATSVNLGFQPQFIIVKNASLAENWMMFDTVRGWDEAGVNIAWLMPNAINAESTITNGYFRRTSTGFDMTSGYTPLNNGSASTEYIYIAIGESSSKSITWSDSIKWDLGVAPVAPDAYATDLHSVFTVDGGTTYYGAKIAGDLS
jgi:6-phosphogluconolactonase (cycloisomerase 2 family)